MDFGNTAENITHIIIQAGAELVVTGANGHKELKDLLYGATINKVRHLENVPVLIVSN